MCGGTFCGGIEMTVSVTAVLTGESYTPSEQVANLLEDKASRRRVGV